MSSRQSVRWSRAAALTVFVASAATLVGTAAVAGVPAGDTVAARPAAPASANAHPAREARVSDGARSAHDNVDMRTAPSAALVRAGGEVLRRDGAEIRAFGATLGPLGRLSVDPLTGTPRNVSRLDGFLTGASARPPAAVALRYVRAHLPALGLAANDLSTLRLRDAATDAHGVVHLSWVQRADGRTVFGNGLRAHVTADGRLIALQGAPISGLRRLAAETPSSRLGAADARARAAANVRGSLVAGSADARSPAKTVSWGNGDRAERVYFAAAHGLRPAWSTYVQLRDGRAYQHVIDAVTGRVLYRHSTVNSERGDALVFRHYPGAATGGTQTVVNLFKRGYLGRKASWLRGRYVFAWADLNDDDLVSANEQTKVPGTKAAAQFTFKSFPRASALCDPDFLCAWDPDVPFSWRANKNQDAAQSFYLASLVHDYLAAAPIGFTPQMGNFEANGADPVLLHTLDGANTDAGLPDANHIDNAFMSTPPDGVPPTMTLLLNHAPGATAQDDPYLPAGSGQAADVVIHEYVHGLSNRLVVDATGNSTLNSLQAGSMGEGWSDYYAEDFLVTRGLLKDTARSGQVLFDRYFSQNRPITRSEAIDCALDASGRLCTKVDLTPGGYTFGDLGNATGGPEVHSDGEIWGQTLWDLRTALGHRVTAAVVTEAMSLSPSDPSFLDERDAIVQADQAVYGGSHYRAIWRVFAGRGMGWFASTSDSGDTHVVEDFRMPPSPTTPLASVSGQVTDDVTGEPIANAVVFIGGQIGRYSDVTDSEGRYQISHVLTGDYPEIFADALGYDLGVDELSLPPGGADVDFALRRDWAAEEGGADLVAFTGPDYGPDFGCGPHNAVDLSYGQGWSTTVGADEIPTETPDPKYIVVRLPEPITIDAFAIDPTNTCGDGGSASLGDYLIEVSQDGKEFSPVDGGTFDSDDRGRLNELPVDESLPGVQYVKVWMQGSQVADEVDCDGPDGAGFSGCTYMDMTEFEVYGQPGDAEHIDAQILSFNDFHGHLEANDPPLSAQLDPSQTPVGGVEYLATAVETLRSSQPDSTLTVAAGDLIGGSTFLSGLFQDQPSIEAMNELGLDVSSVGNHEFDEGTAELQRMVEGGCQPSGCFEDQNGDDIPYDGADFDYLAANVVNESDGTTFLPATAEETIDGIRVGFIGMTLEATPTLVNPDGVTTVDFLDEVATANQQAAALKADGIETIVVLLHEGGLQSGTYNQCVGLSGAIIDIAENITPEVDLLVTGHTHQPYNCVIDDPAGNPRYVTSAASYGQVLTETHLTIDRATREVVRPDTTSVNHLVVRTVAPDPGETSIIDFWKALSEPLAAEVVGTLAPDTDIVGDSSTCRCEETPMVDLVADAMLWGTQADENGGAELALMNTGGVRASLRYNAILNGEDPGEITFAETYNVAPFNNILVTLDMTGVEIEAVLNQQFQRVAARGSRPMLSLGVSDGFGYEWAWEGDPPAPNTQPGPATTGGHVVPGSMTLNGVPIAADQTYRVATLNFLADGGDLFTGFAAGEDKIGGPEDLPNLAAYFTAHPGLTPPADRVSGL
jgi:extracellular elastinolytic metalloproteinase